MELLKFKEILEKYKNLRPKEERKFDQFWATEETVIKRIKLIKNLPEFEKKKIIFLGDDDLTSIALFLFSKHKTTVIDIDQRLINFINLVAKKENLDIETFTYDLRNPLPKELRNFDIVFFDPPYTPYAVNIWLLRAMEASLGSGSNKKRKDIKNLKEKSYLMCYGYTDKESEKGLLIQKIITDLGLVVEDKFRNFNEYYRAKGIQNKSDLYILKPTPKINLKIIDKLKSRLYTFE